MKSRGHVVYVNMNEMSWQKPRTYNITSLTHSIRQSWTKMKIGQTLRLRMSLKGRVETFEVRVLPSVQI